MKVKSSNRATVKCAAQAKAMDGEQWTILDHMQAASEGRSVVLEKRATRRHENQSHDVGWLQKFSLLVKEGAINTR